MESSEIGLQQSSFRTNNLDEAVDFYSQNYTPVVPFGRPSRSHFAWHDNRAWVGPLLVSACRFGASFGASSDGDNGVFALAVPKKAFTGRFEHGADAVPIRGGEIGSMTSPGEKVSAVVDAGFESMTMVVQEQEVMRALGALTGAPLLQRLRFEPRIEVQTGAGASLLRNLQFMTDELGREESLLCAPIVAARMSDAMLYGLLLGQPHNYSSLLTATRQAEPAYVRRAAEYLEANAARPLRMAELTSITGVGLRALQRGFRTYRGCSPLEFLRDRRLELARTRLLASTNQSVTQVALDCGFEHLGRFSRLYRIRYGETPAQTRSRLQ